MLLKKSTLNIATKNKNPDYKTPPILLTVKLIVTAKCRSLYSAFYDNLFSEI